MTAGAQCDKSGVQDDCKQAEGTVENLTLSSKKSGTKMLRFRINYSH